jgi:hypothetical protein
MRKPVNIARYVAGLILALVASRDGDSFWPPPLAAVRGFGGELRTNK